MHIKKRTRELLYKILLAIFPHWMCKASKMYETILTIAW
jgi:hypothetical protein